MTPKEYKEKHHAALKIFLQTDAGREFLPVLRQMRPLFVTLGLPHVHHESSGAVRGYENCEKNILFLSTPAVENEEIEMTYGVPEKKKP